MGVSPGLQIGVGSAVGRAITSLAVGRRKSSMSQTYIADLSLTLINRTGAYHICKDLVAYLPQFFSAKRYWRMHRSSEPKGLARRLLGKAMLLELSNPGLAAHLPAWDGPERSQRTLFLDPLYVLHTALDPADIVLCHDVGPVSMPELFDPGTGALYARAYQRIRAARPGMIFVSEASRTEFVRCFGDNYRFLEVIPLYVRPGSKQGEEVAPAGLREPFLLTVGSQEIRKNYLRSIEAFARSGLRERGYTYVFCGPRANQSPLIEDLARRTPGVHALGFVTEAELRWLYGHASGFVLPSLLEGFGMPALEAAQRGLLSLVSHEGALPEAVGEGAVLVDPLAPDAIADGMRRLVDMPGAERKSRLAIARDHAASLSLERYVARWSTLLAAA